MAVLLHVDSSPRGERSRSRKLAKEFIAAWRELHPEEEIIYRDLKESPIPHVTEEWIEADFTPPEALNSKMIDILKLSNELVDEFLAAEHCLFSVPMYNFSIPSNFKAYIDNIVRFGRMFTVENGQFKGLAEGRKVLFITARGVEYGADSPYAGWDCQEPALRFAFKFIGVQDIQFIHANGLDLGNDAQNRALCNAQAEINRLIATW